MRRKFNLFFSLILLAVAVCGVLFLNNDWARAQGDCLVQAIKSAPGAGDLEFEFNGVEEFGGTFTFFLQDGETTGGFTPVGTTTVITENPPSGWAFGGIECESSPGVIITEIESGFEIECLEPAEAFCVITNVRVAANIPTLSEWGMISAAVGLGLIAVFFAVRRKRMQDA